MVLPDATGEGILLTQGGRHNDYALYLLDGRLVYSWNYFGRGRTSIESEASLPAAQHKLRYEFTPDSEQRGSVVTETV